MENTLLTKLLYRLIQVLEEMLMYLKQLLAYFDRGGNEQLTRQQVIKYLGICEATYKRRVKDGTLKPMKMPGGHRYYKRDLEKAHKESIRRGRI